jgi:DNA-binding NarL/FixJ family response regulator
VGTHLVIEGSVERFRRVAGDPRYAGRGGPRHQATVRTSADAAEAVLAALAGADVLVYATAPRAVVDPLCEDLRRLGRLCHVPAGEPVPAPASALDAADRALMGLLGGGVSLREAARRLFLSPRTADRRLAAIRRHLGVCTTAEAVRAWRAQSAS